MISPLWQAEVLFSPQERISVHKHENSEFGMSENRGFVANHVSMVTKFSDHIKISIVFIVRNTVLYTKNWLRG